MALGLSSGDAPVLLLEFVDWLCPAGACATPPGRDVADRYAALMPGAVRYLVSDFPINADCNPSIRATAPGHEGSCVAAAAVRLAREAGRERAMIGWLGQHRLKLASLEGGAAIAAIKTEVARVLGGSPSEDDYAVAIEAVRREAATGRAIGVSYVPRLYINGIMAGDTSGPWSRTGSKRLCRQSWRAEVRLIVGPRDSKHRCVSAATSGLSSGPGSFCPSTPRTRTPESWPFSS